jgi:hypothetical protein
MAVFDPLYKKGDAVYSAWTQKLRALHRWMTHEIHHNQLCAHSLHEMDFPTSKFHEFSTWKLEHPYGANSRQTDSVNCGVIVLTAIQRIIHGAPIAFPTDSTTMRQARTRI